jgi:hypothetical protein
LAKKARAETATTANDEALEDLIDALKSNIRYAGNKVDFDDDKLKLIGWSGQKDAAALTFPGQSRLLEIPKHGEGWVFLDWLSSRVARNWSIELSQSTNPAMANHRIR